MNDIDNLPSKCRDCAYWELATYPWCCGDCKDIMNPKNGEYIKRIDAKRALTALSADLDAEAVQRCIEAMNNLKAADVEPKRKSGRWIIAGAFDDFYQCPECGEMWPIFSTIEWKCCPICECKIITNRPKGEDNG